MTIASGSMAYTVIPPSSIWNVSYYTWDIMGLYGLYLGHTPRIRFVGCELGADLRLALRGTKHGRKGWNLRGFRQMKHLVKWAFDGETLGIFTYY